MKYLHGKIPISKRVAEKLFPYATSWSCGCWDGKDTSFLCNNWTKRPNSCDRRRHGG